jgi:hypothetical protein
MSNIHNYLNTLLFCVIAKIVSILLLIALFAVPSLRRDWIYTALTLVIGLILIIGLSLYRVRQYSKRTEAAVAAMKENLGSDATQQCPAYFVKTVNADNQVVCKNEVRTADGARIQFSGTGANAGTLPDVNLATAFGPARDNLTTLCGMVGAVPRGAFADYPFTELKDKCASVL